MNDAMVVPANIAKPVDSCHVHCKWPVGVDITLGPDFQTRVCLGLVVDCTFQAARVRTTFGNIVYDIECELGGSFFVV